MKILSIILLVLMVVLLGYAMVAFYRTTPGATVPKRIWGAVLAAVASLLTGLAAWLSPPMVP